VVGIEEECSLARFHLFTRSPRLVDQTE
jgi:hypothetical protein